MLPLRRVVCCLCSTAIVVGILFCTLVETSEIDNNDEQQWTTYNNSNRRKKKCFHIYLPRSVCLLLSSSCHSRILASPNPLIQYTLLPRLAPSRITLLKYATLSFWFKCFAAVVVAVVCRIVTCTQLMLRMGVTPGGNTLLCRRKSTSKYDCDTLKPFVLDKELCNLMIKTIKYSQKIGIKKNLIHFSLCSNWFLLLSVVISVTFLYHTSFVSLFMSLSSEINLIKYIYTCRAIYDLCAASS